MADKDQESGKMNDREASKQHLTQDEITCFRILETRRKREVAYIRHVSALRKHGDLVFHGRDAQRLYFF